MSYLREADIQEPQTGFPKPKVRFSRAMKKLKGEVGDSTGCRTFCFRCFVEESSWEKVIKGVRYEHLWSWCPQQDTLFMKTEEWVGDGKGEGNFWSIFLICDGHCGDEAALFTSKKLWKMLKPNLPTCQPPSGNDCESDAWCKSVQRAIVKTFVQLEKDFAKEDSIAGSTVTLALVCGWTLTIANLGDSDAMLDTIGYMGYASVSHRLDSSEPEKERLRRAGVHLGRLEKDLSTSSGSESAGFGPIRCWPGGLANARSIGDRDGGKNVVALPHIRQGARIFMASDGLWDIIDHENAVELSRPAHISLVADRLMTRAIFQNAWAFGDDISIIVIEITPYDGDDFHVAAREIRRSASVKKKFMRKISCVKPSDGKVKQGFLCDPVEMIADVDGLEVDLEEVEDRNCGEQGVSKLAARLPHGHASLSIADALDRINLMCNMQRRIHFKNGSGLIKSTVPL